MAYRITYDWKNGTYEVHKTNPRRFPFFLGCALALFLVGTLLFWEAGAEIIRDVLIPGDDEVTARAVQTMAGELKNGVSMMDAIENFCVEVMHGAKNPG